MCSSCVICLYLLYIWYISNAFKVFPIFSIVSVIEPYVCPVFNIWFEYPELPLLLLTVSICSLYIVCNVVQYSDEF
jgi:hypothetical protein